MDPDLALLTGPDAEDLLGAAVATLGAELLAWRPRQVDHRPGDSTTVAYAARLRDATGERELTLAASTGLGVAQGREGVLSLTDGEREVAVWAQALDPGLPGLAGAMEPAGLLAAYGVDVPVTARVRAYRPRRRAVVEVRGEGVHLFLKVLRPSKVEALHERHRLLREAGLPSPASLGWTDDGVLVLDALPGRSLRTSLREGATDAPTAEHLLALLDRLPREVCDLPRRGSWTEDAGHYAAVLAAVLPEEAGRVTQLADRIAALTGQEDDAAVHGDLYEAQLLVGGGRVTGLLDVDTAGPGRREDDLACLLGHAAVLAQLEPEHAATTHELGARWLAVFDRHHDPSELRARVAGVTLSLATGPHRVQEHDWPTGTRRRIDLVERWVDSAERARVG